MNKESYNLKALTKQALLSELFAAKLYFWARGKTNNQKAKILLAKLQKMEETHFQKLLPFFKKLLESENNNFNTQELKLKFKKEAQKLLLKKIKEMNLKVKYTLRQIIKFAINEEDEAKALYQTLLLQNSEPFFRTIFETLITEEESHKEELEKIFAEMG